MAQHAVPMGSDNEKMIRAQSNIRGKVAIILIAARVIDLQLASVLLRYGVKAQVDVLIASCRPAARGF